MAADTPSAPRIGLVMPAFNEEAALPLVLAELPRGQLARLVVVDNGSTDRTAQVAAEAGAEVVNELRRGYGQACLTGIERLWVDGGPGRPALGDHDVVVFLDADHSDYPDDLLLTWRDRCCAGEADLVDRFAHPGRAPDMQRTPAPGLVRQPPGLRPDAAPVRRALHRPGSLPGDPLRVPRGSSKWAIATSAGRSRCSSRPTAAG